MLVWVSIIYIYNTYVSLLPPPPPPIPPNPNLIISRSICPPISTLLRWTGSFPIPPQSQPHNQPVHLPPYIYPTQVDRLFSDPTQSQPHNQPVHLPPYIYPTQMDRLFSAHIPQSQPHNQPVHLPPYIYPTQMDRLFSAQFRNPNLIISRSICPPISTLLRWTGSFPLNSAIPTS